MARGAVRQALRWRALLVMVVLAVFVGWLPLSFRASPVAQATATQFLAPVAVWQVAGGTVAVACRSYVAAAVENFDNAIPRAERIEIARKGAIREFSTQFAFVCFAIAVEGVPSLDLNYIDYVMGGERRPAFPEELAPRKVVDPVVFNVILDDGRFGTTIDLLYMGMAPLRLPPIPQR